MTARGSALDRERIWAMVQALKTACAEGKGFERLEQLFHDEAVVVAPGFDKRAEGRETCLRHYADACGQMKFEHFDYSDEAIDVFGDTAVASFRYDCAWEFQGKRVQDTGHELMTFARAGGDWRLAWRTVVPREREVRRSDVASLGRFAENMGPIADLRETLRALMSAAPACYLTLIDADGFPQTTAMLNLRDARLFPNAARFHEERGKDFLLYLTTGLDSPKAARARANPKASVHYCDPTRVIGLLLVGEIEFAEDPEVKRRIWQDGWTMYYPSGVDGPEYGVLKLDPHVIKGWTPGGGFEFPMKGGEA